VLDVDVQDAGVQWGRCLRVRVHLSVTKKLVQGKKITVEGGESRWVNFKYERLPNFCYQCGLLSHALKDCPDQGKCINQSENEGLQYGAWLRGEIMRRYMHKSPKAGMGRGPNSGSSQWNADGNPGRRSTMNRTYEVLVEAGGDHKVGLSCIEQCSLTQTKAKDRDSGRATESSHENGRVNRLMEKQDGKKMEVERKASDQSNVQTKNVESTQGEKAKITRCGKMGRINWNRAQV